MCKKKSLTSFSKDNSVLLELNSDRFFCDLLKMMSNCCIHVRRCSSATPGVFVFASACLVVSSICASAFVKCVLLSLVIVDKVARSVCVMLSFDCFVNFPMSSSEFFANLSMSFLICSTVCYPLLIRARRHVPLVLLRLSFLSSLSSVSVAACSVGSVVVPVPRLSWSDGSMVSLFWILYCMSALLVVS